MAQDSFKKLKNLVSQVEANDPELMEELKDKRSSAALKDNGLEITELLNSNNELESFEIQDAGLEAVILRVGRPVLLINNSTATLKFEDAESEVWRKKLDKAKEKLALAIPSVGRIEMQNHPMLHWCGTGWLVDKDIIVTNRHVAEIFGRAGSGGFIFRQGSNGEDMKSSIDLLVEEANPNEKLLKLNKILHIEPEPGPDMAFIKVSPMGGDLPAPVLLDTGKLKNQTEIAVIGYPASDSRMPDVQLMKKIFGDISGKKRLAPGQITNITADKLFHDCSTLGGCSGGAIISLETGKAVALHFGGRFLESNYAVPAAHIDQRLQQIKTGKVSIPVRGNENNNTAASGSGDRMNPSPGNSVTFDIPLQITVALGQAAGNTSISISTQGGGKIPPKDPDEFTLEGVPADFSDRTGYDHDFLGKKFRVPLPEITGNKRKKDILTYKLKGKDQAILNYQNFSVVMSKGRRQCFYSAVNINGGKSKKATRTPWRFDPRIPQEAQIMHECYGNAPRYSRGHMTRREDPVWGTDRQALQGNSDSMCVTNAVPQMQSFNAPVWLALEDYALSHSREDKMNITVFTGPVFKTNDPVQYGIKIPKEFWKLIVFIHDDTGKLTATGYMMSQEDFIPDVEFVFGEFRTAQVSIASIEKKTGLSFGKLTALDPMSDEAAIDPIRPLSGPGQIRY